MRGIGRGLAAASVLVAVSGCTSADPDGEPGSTAPRPSTTSTSATTSPSGTATTPGRVTLPPAGARFSYQIGGPYDVPDSVRVVSRDRTAPAAAGAYSICYVNAFQAQPDAVDWWQREHPDLLLRDASGGLVVDEEWDEPLLDVSTAPQRAALIEVVGSWVDQCATDGYRAVEADNLDSSLRSRGLLTEGDDLAFGALLATRAHAAGLALGQKNASEQAVAAKAAGFDFAVAEECEVYRECEAYTEVYGDQLIEIEYTDQDEAAFDRACRERGDRVSVTRRDRDVLPAGESGHVEQWCP